MNRKSVELQPPRSERFTFTYVKTMNSLRRRNRVASEIEREETMVPGGKMRVFQEESDGLC